MLPTNTAPNEEHLFFTNDKKAFESHSNMIENNSEHLMYSMKHTCSSNSKSSNKKNSLAYSTQVETNISLQLFFQRLLNSLCSSYFL